MAYSKAIRVKYIDTDTTEKTKDYQVNTVADDSKIKAVAQALGTLYQSAVSEYKVEVTDVTELT